jgi:hypothetical protein
MARSATQSTLPRGAKSLLRGGGVALIAIVLLGFGVNAAVRLPCRDACGVDLGRLYEDRGIDRAHPPYIDRDLEYPPVIGIMMYAATVPFDQGLRGKFLVNVVLLTALAAVTTWMLWRRYGSATRRWALAPPLFLEGLTNWDLLAVAPATIALLEWEAGAAALAGLLLGIGAAAKLFPALFVPVLVASCVPDKAWARARAVIAGALLGASIFVIPTYAFAPGALRHFVSFHQVRGPNSDTFWYYAMRNPDMQPWFTEHRMVAVVNVLSALLLAAAFIVIVLQTGRARLTAVAGCALATIAFIVTNKIYSPQYDLWVVPFLVMLPVRTKLVVHFYVSSVVVWLLTATEDHVLHRPTSLYVLAAGVTYRLVVLLLIARDIWRSGEPDRPFARDDDSALSYAESLAYAPPT